MKALILVDIQNDFIDGSLQVPNGIEVVNIANYLINEFKNELIIATQDWHPKGHCSFASTYGVSVFDTVKLKDGTDQICWPDHCVQDTTGAKLHSNLKFNSLMLIKKGIILIRKGTDLDVDSYSGFWDNARKNDTGLSYDINDAGVDEVYIVGLATDYCVKFTAIDSVDAGFKTFVILEGCRGVAPETTEAAIKEMKAAGVTVLDKYER